jgi:hypothetical protein
MEKERWEMKERLHKAEQEVAVATSPIVSKPSKPAPVQTKWFSKFFRRIY